MAQDTIPKEHQEQLGKLIHSLIYYPDERKKTLAELPQAEDLYKTWASKLPLDLIRYGRDRAAFILNGYKKPG